MKTECNKWEISLCGKNHLGKNGSPFKFKIYKKVQKANIYKSKTKNVNKVTKQLSGNKKEMCKM